MGEPLGAEVAEPLVDPVIDELAESIIEIEEQMVALVVDMEGDLAMLFGDDDFSDDDSEGFEDDEEVWEVNEEWLMAPVTPPPMPVMPLPSTYEVGGPFTAVVEGLSFALLAPGFPVPPCEQNDLGYDVLDGSEEGETRAGPVPKWSRADVQHKDVQIQQLQALVSDMSNRESTLMQCTLGMDRRLADLERRPPGPQFPRWVEAKVVSSEDESEKWRRLLLHQMRVAIDVATDGRKEDFFPRNGN
ncbi:hypothetical protein Tco_0575542 [Tanacetum coccineum]